jgi:hypothetical protein
MVSLHLVLRSNRYEVDLVNVSTAAEDQYFGKLIFLIALRMGMEELRLAGTSQSGFENPHYSDCIFRQKGNQYFKLLMGREHFGSKWRQFNVEILRLTFANCPPRCRPNRSSE